MEINRLLYYCLPWCMAHPEDCMVVVAFVYRTGVVTSPWTCESPSLIDR